MTRAVESSLASIPPVPRVRAGYYHDYFCNDHGSELSPTGHSGDHACPVDGRIFNGHRLDLGHLWSVNSQLSRSALSWAIFATVEPGSESADARSALRSVLIDYAAVYPALAQSPGGLADYPGLVTFSGLDESVWLVRMAWAYGLARRWLPSDDQARIEADILRPATAHLSRIRCPPSWPPIDNIAVWAAAALIAASAAVGDTTTVAVAVDGPLGLREQLARGVLADGLWWEGSLGYHYYALAATVWAFRTLHAAGLPLGDIQMARRMFEGPLALRFPDATLPSMNDGWHNLSLLDQLGHDVPSAAGFRATAAAWFGLPSLADVVRGYRDPDPDPDMELAALLDGPPIEEPAARAAEADTHPPRHRVFDSGPVILRAGDAVAVLKAGPAGGTHGHPDQLALQLFATGERILDDLGTVGYGTDLNRGWYRATASHSTLVIDGTSQPPADGQGRSVDLGDDAVAAVGTVRWPAWPSTGSQHPGLDAVNACRHVALTADYLLDVLEVECARPREVDWVILPKGMLIDAPNPNEGVDVLGSGAGGGYEHVVGQVRLERPEPLRWQIGAAGELTVLFDATPADSGEILVVGEAPGNPASERLGVVVRRRIARSTTFRAILAFGAPGTPAGVVTWPSERGSAIVAVVALPDRTDEWSVVEGLLRLRRR